MKIKCKICGKEFAADLFRVRKGQGVFCSRKCYGEWRSKNISGKNNSNWRGGLKNRKIKTVDRVCETCGKKIKVRQDIIKRGWGRFCSQNCHSEYQSINRMGENCPTWKGGISKIQSRLRASRKYLFWRKEVFKRDNYTCQKCGQVGGRLEAHHKRRFSKMLDYIKKRLPLIPLYEAAMIYPPLWNVTNGITLCKKCHKLRHKKLGKRGNK